MASKQVSDRLKIARRIDRRLTRAGEILGLTVDSFYLKAGENAKIPQRDIINHIGDYHLSVQGDGLIDPPPYVRQLINRTLKKRRQPNRSCQPLQVRVRDTTSVHLSP